MIARVEPLTRTRAVRGPFDYRLGRQQASVDVGSVLEVPFGGRRAVGVVVSLAERSELAPERLAEPYAVLADSIPPDLVALATWMAAEYCSTPARALSLVLAPGGARTTPRRQPLFAELTVAGGQALSATSGVSAGARRLTAGQRETLARLTRDGPVPAAVLGHAGARRLQARGLLALNPRAPQSRPGTVQPLGSARAAPAALTPEQEAALEAVLGALAARTGPADGGHLLLHGVTGSGKTEVYLRAVNATLAAGRGAIVLVPEIALTPQALGRFSHRFGAVVAVLHSGLTPGERREQWLALRSGAARVCVGPRSAVFAPIEELGLIVVDEEHESSYKHEGDPRYDARTVAEQRARQSGATLLLGSATPRPESVRSLPRLRLPRRIDGRPLPPVRVLDMRGQHHPMHPETRVALAEVRRAGRKAIIMLNRRGWSNFLSCRACGRVWSCPDCEVALVLHRAAGFLACHHCGHREPAPERCSQCGSSSVARHGAGTERVERELLETLADRGFPVFRLDADASRGERRGGRALERFERAPAGVLVGTQMVAKGHDFPDVTLAVVLDADQTLRFPDFRSEERTFALLTQLAGRAGRGDAGGRVLVQTLAPDARAIRFAARHDSDGFLADELARRDALGYPPFSSLIRIVCSAERAADAHRVAQELHARIAAPGAALLGPAPLFRLRAQARSQLVIKAADRGPAIRAVGSAVDSLARSRRTQGVSVSVDVDPQ